MPLFRWPLPLAGAGGAPAEITGTLAASETADAAAFTGSANVFGPLAASEAPDTAAFAGGVTWQATLAASEVADTAAFTGTAAWLGTLAASEAADTAAFTGDVVVSGSLVASEAADTAAFAGDVSGVVVSGSLAATEAADTAAFAGTVTGVAGALAASEAGDTAAFSGEVTGIGVPAGYHARKSRRQRVKPEDYFAPPPFGQKIKKVIQSLEAARDNDKRAASLEAAQTAAEDLDEAFAVTRLIAAIEAVDAANNKRAQIVSALAEARRVEDEIRQEDEDEQAVLAVLMN